MADRNFRIVSNESKEKINNMTPGANQARLGSNLNGIIAGQHTMATNSEAITIAGSTIMYSSRPWTPTLPFHLVFLLWETAWPCRSRWTRAMRTEALITLRLRTTYAASRYGLPTKPIEVRL